MGADCRAPVRHVSTSWPLINWQCRVTGANTIALVKILSDCRNQAIRMFIWLDAVTPPKPTSSYLAGSAMQYKKCSPRKYISRAANAGEALKESSR